MRLDGWFLHCGASGEDAVLRAEGGQDRIMSPARHICCISRAGSLVAKSVGKHSWNHKCKVRGEVALLPILFRLSRVEEA